MDKTNIPKANTKDELINILSQFDISLPPVGDGRTKEHDERLAICMLLSALAHTDELTYALSLEHKDKPDFRLHEGDNITGIEVTFARNQDQAHFKAMMNRSDTSKIYSTNVFQPEQRLSQAEKEAYLTEDLPAFPLMGDQPYKNWATYVSESIKKKILDFDNSKFEKFSKNILVVFVETPEQVAVSDIDKAIQYLTPELDKAWAEVVHFDCIYVQHYQQIAKLKPSEETKILDCNDIWGFFG